MWTLSQFESQNGAALQTLITKHNVELIKFPDDVMAGLKKLSVDIVEAEAAKDPMAKKVHEDFKAFQKVIGTWGAISERAYYNDIVEKYALKA
ncbi:MAG: hypothetical protein COW41_02515 [Deltaproteobacteria bacterium CG17_big_fil_post_rev_8_21_14_2_50_51_6]|nr:MAG: hypothetical protein COW41_02515 [Deltaproteobacteria bacterium CG17_big_fil_post_rev_8_21_14_2_50_51_6]